MFYLSRFDDLDLPLIEARQDISSGESLSPFRPLQDGGGFRVRGTQRSPRGTTRISASGEFLLETAATDIEVLGKALYRKRGEARKLYRHTRGTEEAHWCWAELMRVGSDTTPDTAFVQPVAPEFLMYSPCWYGSHHGGETWELDDGVLLDTGRTLDEADGDVFTLPSGSPALPEIAVVNGGNFHIDNAILTITASATDPITGDLRFGTLDPDGHDSASLIFYADIPATKSLVIDCGARTVLLDGVDAYADLEIQSDHALGGWLRLYPGTTTIGFTYTAAADATLVVDFSDGQE